ncbi:MAG: pyridoxal phosphate-dependent class II aminotransferase [Rhodobacteraceae bacterium]|jgi:cobalamin biosynthetic protein CobC|nr:pyridoxal phosphate-dependent class II aminotransferase [Paracoccaceae bacterium]
MTQPLRDHGGGIDAARAIWGGARADWLDLSTGINPEPWPLPDLPAAAWTDLPDRDATDALVAAARTFWAIPPGAAVLPVPGTSAAIARIPALAAPATAHIPGPTYNEHAAAFAAQGWRIGDAGATACVIVHPNNPDGRLWPDAPAAPLTVIDESFADLCPDLSLIGRAARPGTLVLKSFGKFWGLAGLRLGVVAGDPALVDRLAALVGPWAVSGPALAIGTRALGDSAWAEATRRRLSRDAARLDRLLAPQVDLVGGTDLFRLYSSPIAGDLHTRLARSRILTRLFPWDARLIRVGLPPADGWSRLEAAL